jgi:exopolysaccharide biosynthesis polyprenyl glycosylphosphotransferase
LALPHLVTARRVAPDDEETRAPHRAFVMNGGLFAAAAAPTVAAMILSGSLNGPRGAGAALVVSAIWYAALATSLTAHAKELLALGVLPATARGTFYGLICISAADFWIARIGVQPLALGATAVGVFVLASGWEAFAVRHLEPRRRVLIVGTGRNSAQLVDELNGAPELPFVLVGLVDDGSGNGVVPPGPILGEVSRLPEILARYRPELVVVAVERDRPTTFGHLLDSASTGFKVLELPQFYEHALGRVPVRDLPRAWFMSILHLYQRPHSRGAKRAFDIVVAALGLFLMAPSMLVTALLVRRTPGPIILRQTRLGEHGRPFTIYKFRTMRQDAEAAGGAVWASQQDPRITRVGGVLRRMRLDEMPQLWNVLRGEMSIVGPRPERPEFLAQLQEEVPYWTRRHLVKPGVTGWAQIRRGYTDDVDGSSDKLSYDLWYLRHRSVLVDLAICLQTVKTMVFGGEVVTRPQPQQPPLAAVPQAPLDAIK